jgi:hypothetical protein
MAGTRQQPAAPRRTMGVMTTATAIAPFVIHGLAASVAERLRCAGGEVQQVTASPGWPCRQCLRDIEVGDDALLVSYDPFDDGSTSAYRTPSPIFLHRRSCATATPTDVPPPQLTGRVLSVRAFDAADRMIHAHVVGGASVGATLAEVFADADVTHAHVHNAGPGCFAAKVTRPF